MEHSPTQTVKSLTIKKYAIFHRLKKIRDLINEDPSFFCKNDICGLIEILEKNYENFCQTNREINEIVVRNNNIDYFAEDLGFKCELLYLELKKHLLMVQSEDAHVPDKLSNVKEDDSEKKNCPPDLSKLKVQKFSGDLTDWPAFRQEYQALVHSNSNLTNPQKFTILKSLLPTEVFMLIENIYLYRDDIGYEDAWALCEEKFSKRKNVEEILTTLLQQPPVNGSVESIVQLLETTKKCLSNLMHWDVDTRNWDVFLVQILVQKLNEETRNEWYSSEICRSSSTSRFDFFNFLYSKLRTQESSCKMGIDLQRRKCVYCRRNHPLWKCDKFESLDIDGRLSFVQNKAICGRCLAQEHTTSQCWKPFKCRICQSKEHHYLLHRNMKRTKSCEKLFD